MDQNANAVESGGRSRPRALAAGCRLKEPYGRSGLSPHVRTRHIEANAKEVSMPNVRSLALAALVAAAATPSMAQLLPRESPAERQVRSTNQAIQQQQQIQSLNAQTQAEINGLRDQIQRNRMFPPSTGPGVNPGCPPGSIGC